VDVVEALGRLGGVATTAELVAATSAAEVRTALDAGVIRRAGRRSIVLPDSGQALTAAGRLSGVVSHESAAAHWHLWTKRPVQRPVVTVARNRHIPAHRCREVDVRYADLAAEDVVGPVTSVAATVVAIARRAPLDEALVVADSALRTRRCTRAEMVAAVLRSPRTGRRKAARVVREATPCSGSAFESVVRGLSLDVPGVDLRPQVEVAPNLTPDLVDRRLRLVVECDSFGFHAGRVEFKRDMERYNTLVRRGWQVLRIAWEHAYFEPDYVRYLLADLAQEPYRQAVRR